MNWNIELSKENTLYLPNNKNKQLILNKNITTDQQYINYKKSALIHKNIRNEIKNNIKSGVEFKFICLLIDKLLKKTPEADLAFPVGISVNNVVMHDSILSLNDDRKFNRGDVVKIDLGIHIDGSIIDCAFTQIVDEDNKTHKYKNILDASLDSVYSAISASGPDARLYEISEDIQEVIESYTLEDSTQIVPIFGIGGHKIDKYKLHCEKLVLCIPHDAQKNMVMEEGEIYAIETYASNGSGKTYMGEYNECSHFCKNDNLGIIPKHNEVLKWSEKKRRGLPFNKYWIDLKNKKTSVLTELKRAVNNLSIIGYPPVYEKDKKSVVAQYEHTIAITKNGTEIFTIDEDY